MPKKTFNFIQSVLLQLKRFLKREKKSQRKDARLLWRGRYGSWEEAQKNSTGYDTENIFKKTADAILRVKNGEAIYERDSVLMDRPQYSWPLLAILLKVASEKNNTLNILDFGGSLGSSYFQNRTFLNSTKMLWSVVEQHNYIAYGNEKIADEILKFYFTVDECLSDRNPQILLLSGVIQYIDNPYKLLEEFIEKGFEYIVFDRTSFISDSEDRLTIQCVPKSVYEASYPAWFFNKSNILKVMEDKYDFVLDFNNGFTTNIELDGKIAYWNGLFFRRK